ncbi:MAG TPA: SPOR domain-containing protein [Usitatibacter sp.]|nr:SPOR domain-containing protein [Usitatibacter sp.]
MATPASSETIEIRRRGRQRLIGAIVIVVVVVVFLPMLLDSGSRNPRDEPSTRIPSMQNAPALPAPAPAPKAITAPPPAPAPAPSAAPKPAAEPVASVTPAPPAKVETASSAKAPRLEGFAVQVGAFRDDEKLREAREKLVQAGLSHYTERLGDTGITRLRAGPFPTREAAEKARAALQRVSLDGQVVPLP